MRRQFAVFALTLLALGWVFGGSVAPRGGSAAAVTAKGGAGLGSVETLEARYAAWSRAAISDPRGVAIAVGPAPWLITETSAARGTVWLTATTVRAELAGLGEGQFELWAVDQQDGPGNDVIPKIGDGFLPLGSLSALDGRWTFRARIDDARFEVDSLVVTRAGLTPADSRLAIGMPQLFDRLHLRRLRDSHRGGGVWRWLARVPALFDGRVHAQIGPIPNPSTPLQQLVSQGRALFFNESFDGNGRTCGTCHREDNNLTIDPEFIAKLPPNDPLFVAEFIPALAANFENPLLMRRRGLILVNPDGFDNLSTKFVMRGVPSLLALLPNSLAPAALDETFRPPNERTGWGGDAGPVGAFTLPGGTVHQAMGLLRDVPLAMVAQHFPKTLNRQPGVDFRLPTSAELDALEAFMKSLGRLADVKLAGPSQLTFKSPVAQRGKQIFNNPGSLPPFFNGSNAGAGKCLLCHFNAGAGDFFETVILGGSNDPGVATENGQVVGNANFDTGVEDLPSKPADLLVPPSQNPPDGGFGRDPIFRNGSFVGFGNGAATPLNQRAFNTPVLVEAADTGPFFHDNSVGTIEAAVAFYSGPAFNDSPIGAAIPGGIRLDATEVEAVAAMLRVLNTLENIRSSVDLETRAKNASSFGQAQELLKLSLSELDDAISVLGAGKLHPEAIDKLRTARELDEAALLIPSTSARNAIVNQALALKASARADLVVGSDPPPNQPPLAEAGPDQSFECAGPDGVSVTLDATGSSDPDGDALTYHWTGPFGETTGATPVVVLGDGSHVVTLTVSDGRGGSSTDTMTVTIADTTPPTISSLVASPGELWPPNWKPVRVTLTPQAADDCGGAVDCQVVRVMTRPDRQANWRILGPLTVVLHAVPGQVYTIVVRCTDEAGNANEREVEVAVSRSRH